MPIITFLGLHTKHKINQIVNNQSLVPRRAEYLFNTYFIGQLSHLTEQQAAQLLYRKVADYLSASYSEEFLQAFVKALQQFILLVKSEVGYNYSHLISRFGDYQHSSYSLVNPLFLRSLEN